MKFVCLLLSFCVILLSVRPCCADSDCAKLVTVKTAGKSTTEKACAGCSPFFVCGSCAGFIISKPVNYTILHLPEIPLKHNSVYQHPFIEDVTLAIWQPPQID